MHRAFDLVQQPAGAVKTDPWTDAGIERPDLEFLGGLPLAACLKACPQDLVDGLLERDSGSCGLDSKPGRQVVFQSQRGAHIMMLTATHQDVKAASSPPGAGEMLNWGGTEGDAWRSIGPFT